MMSEQTASTHYAFSRDELIKLAAPAGGATSAAPLVNNISVKGWLTIDFADQVDFNDLAAIVGTASMVVVVRGHVGPLLEELCGLVSQGFRIVVVEIPESQAISNDIAMVIAGRRK